MIYKQSFNNTYGTAAVLDVETTGLDPFKDEVVELAIISFSFDDGGVVINDSIEEYSSLREPTRPIPPAATQIHGLTDQDVAGCRLDRERILSIASSADYFIAHNAEFDRPFVEMLFPEFSRKPWLCTMRGINWRMQGVTSRGLVHLARHFGIPHSHAHRALHDARTTFKLLTLTGPNGLPLLADLVSRGLPPTGHAPAN